VRICVLGSGSRGNSIYVESRGKAVLLDQGFSFREIEKRMTARGLDPASIVAVLVTHEHDDHIRGVGVTARKLHVPVYATRGTLGCNKNIFNGFENLRPIESGERFEVGPFEIMPFRVSHDAADPVQFRVRSGRRKIAVATDLGFVSTLVQQNLRDSDLVIVESNHDVDMLRNGSYPWELKQRIMSRTGHLSNRNAAEAVFNLWSNGRSPRVILAHLSEENNRPELAEREIRELFERYDYSLEGLLVAAQDEPTEIIEI